MNNIKQNSKISITILLVSIILFYYLNHIFPFVKDDLVYKFMVAPGNYVFNFNAPADTWGKIIESQTTLYKEWEGRSLILALSQAFCGLTSNKEYYNIFATILFALFIPFWGKLCFPNISIKQNLSVALLSTFSFWLIAAEAEEIYCGATYGMNYLYSPLICILFIVAFQYKGIPAKYKTIYAIALSMIGFHAGWSQELFTISFGGYLFFWTIQNRKSIERYQWIAMSFFIIGALILIFCPGNFVRADNGGDTSKSIFGPIYIYTRNYTLYAFCFAAVVLFFWRKKNLLKFIRKEYPLLVSWIVSFIFISLAIGRKEMDGRIFAGIEMLNVIIFYRLLTYLGFENTIRKASTYISILFPTLLAIIISYQIPAVNAQKALYEKCTTQSGPVYFEYPHLEIPKLLRKYIYYRHELENNTIWEGIYPSYFKKEVYAYDEEAINCFTPENKIAGNNPFYKTEFCLYSKEPLADTIHVEIQKNGFQSWDSFHLLKRAKRILFPNLSDKEQYQTMERDFKSKKIKVGENEHIYSIHLPIDKFNYHIKSINIK